MGFHGEQALVSEIMKMNLKLDSPAPDTLLIKRQDDSHILDVYL